MDSVSYIRAIIALAFVLGLIGLAAVLVRKFGIDKSILRNSANKRLSVEDIATIDARHRLVIVKCDNTEHLLLLGPHGDKVVESNITGKNGNA